MNSCGNLNDIPIQFRQFEHTNNTSEKNVSKENINTDNLKITSEKQSIQAQLNAKDKIFIFLILAIFFEAL